ncbi:MAG: thioredoxin family protein [Planctomycetota bacterium]
MHTIQNYSATEFLERTTPEAELELVHFSSPLFTGCKYVSSQLKNLAGSFGDRISFAEVTIELQKTELIREFEVEQLPTIVFLKGSTEVERLETLLAPDELREFLELCAGFYGPTAQRD